MAGMRAQLLGFFLGLLGFAGAVVATVLPHWCGTTFVSSNVITATAYMKGLWMECVWDSTGIYQCQPYRSLLALPPDMQAARALMVVSCLSSVCACAIAVSGMNCTRFAQHTQIKTRLLLSGGVGFLCAGMLCLITVSWTSYDVAVQSYDPFLFGVVNYEVGSSVYLGYISTCLSLTAGAVLCWSSKNVKAKKTLSRPEEFMLNTSSLQQRSSSRTAAQPSTGSKRNHAPVLTA